jgi:hypothetical protein
MAVARFVAFVAVSLALTAPAFAEIYGPNARGQLWGWEGPDYHSRLADYRNLVVRKTRADGGALTPDDSAMLHKRLQQLMSEERVKYHPSWTKSLG